ncbi:MAG: hydantoinase B/oxoprolinase family protein [Candidatus Eremiobacteraeota bacterium]|nr:hydantoinase B/oxoprolinase family protein [Candidatus Eremiobacteraeota bacterium]
MIDAVTLALLAETLTSFVREMRTVVIRTAFSPMIHEGHDFSCAILTPDGELAAASEVDQPTHLSALPWSVRTILARYPGDVAEGDLFLHNDPYTGGTHLNDVVLMRPVLFDRELLAHVAVMAHWQDVGGAVPGSLSGTATEIFQEGVRIPGVRIQHRGTPLEEVQALLWANVREPSERRGDLKAMEGACILAEAKLKALAQRRGAAIVRETMTTLLDRAERRMRAAIARLPDGVYRCETYLDNSGDTPEPLLLKVALRVRGDELTADFTGCPPEVPGPTNLGPAHASTAVFTMTKAFLDPHGPINAGAMRPLHTIVPEGTMLNARLPAACGAIGEVRRALEGLVMGALGRAVPERAVGDLKGASNITTIAWRGKPPFVEFPAGGTGGWATSDGNNAVRNFAEGDLSSIQPAEAIEVRWPMRVERIALRVDSGGAGEHRGGLGIERELRILEPGATLSVLSDHNVIPPYGVNGGFPGAPNRFVIRRGGDEVLPSKLPGKVSVFKLEADDVVVMQTAGGGGFGDPTKRDAALVEHDLAFGYVSPAARDLYASPARTALRARTISSREGKRLAPLSPGTAKRLGLQSGALVEMFAHGPSLRAWIVLDDGFADDAIGIDEQGFEILGIRPDETVSLRRIGTNGG